MLELFEYAYIRNGFLAGTCVAIIAAVVGYFLLVRGLTFAGHALSHMGFAGAAGAVLVGLHPLIGLLAFSIGAGVGIGFLGKNIRERDLAVGILMTLTLGLGLLFMTLHRGSAERLFSFLFGSMFGISWLSVQVTAFFSLGALIILLIIARPLLFSSLDPVVAESRGVPVRLLGIVFMILLGVTVAVAVQVVGVLLIFTLLVGPAATAMRLVHRPLAALLLSVVLSLGYTWLGLVLAELTAGPATFYIATLSFGVYLPVRLLSPLWENRRARVHPTQVVEVRAQVRDIQPAGQLSMAMAHEGGQDA